MTSVAAVCSVYSTTFFVPEAYYLQLIVSADEFNKGFNNENAQAWRAELADDVAKLWGTIPHRNAAPSARCGSASGACAQNARARVVDHERDAACARAACSSSRPRANWSGRAT